MNGLRHVALPLLIGLLSELVHCQIGTSYQQNHPNHVLSNMMQNTDPIMAPSIATPQTGKIPPNQVSTRSIWLIKAKLLSFQAIRVPTMWGLIIYTFF